MLLTFSVCPSLEVPLDPCRCAGNSLGPSLSAKKSPKLATSTPKSFNFVLKSGRLNLLVECTLAWVRLNAKTSAISIPGAISPKVWFSQLAHSPIA